LALGGGVTRDELKKEGKTWTLFQEGATPRKKPLRSSSITYDVNRKKMGEKRKKKGTGGAKQITVRPSLPKGPHAPRNREKRSFINAPSISGSCGVNKGAGSGSD